MLNTSEKSGEILYHYLLLEDQSHQLQEEMRLQKLWEEKTSAKCFLCPQMANIKKKDNITSLNSCKLILDIQDIGNANTRRQQN